MGQREGVWERSGGYAAGERKRRLCGKENKMLEGGGAADTVSGRERVARQGVCSGRGGGGILLQKRNGR